jgi:hypothetical protein
VAAGFASLVGVAPPQADISSAATIARMEIIYNFFMAVASLK